jgi:CheY-like chemotaxis protein
MPDLHGINVLAVSPRLDCLTLFQTYLGSVGAQVTTLPDLAAAQSQLAQKSPNTVLLLDLTQAVGLDHGASQRKVDALDTRVVRLVRRLTSGTEAHVIEVLARPLLYHDLLQGVALACQRISITELAAGTAVAASAIKRIAPSVEAAAQSGQLILLAEDNETNRDVMSEQLRLLGYACEMAIDGEKALAMWRAGCGSNGNPGRYAMLLTDCHMPNLDGFELTGAIRLEEPQGTHLPIIAITANATQGEAERCHDRGMDGYLCKPLRMRELGDMLHKWLPQPDAEPTHSKPLPLLAAPADSLAIWNPNTLNMMVGHNPEVHQRLLQKFLPNADLQCQQISTALQAGDLTALTMTAHALKSAARSVGALALGELCQRLENSGNAKNEAACSALAADLASALAAAAHHINAHLEGLSHEH